MALIYSVFLWLFFKASSCHLHCVKETPDDTEFSINVTTHIKVESGDCIYIPYEFTFPTNKVTVPYRKIWFEGDPQNTVRSISVTEVEYRTKDTFVLHELPRGEYEYGFKLEWECNQTYIFPKKVQISVSALTKRPVFSAPPMTEGQHNILACWAEGTCSQVPHVYWQWTKTRGLSSVLRGDVSLSGMRDFGYNPRRSNRKILRISPTADDHNTNITCVADYGHSVVKTTVTLTVKFSPRILNGSQCMLEGKLLVCECISRGNPPPPITWPSASLTDFSVSSSSGIQTVNSTITMSAADYHNSTFKCTSSNEVGQAEVEIPIQNYTGNTRVKYGLDLYPKDNAVALFIIAGVFLTLNVVLFAMLIICTYKRRCKSQQKEPGEEMNTYTSLNWADVAEPYSVISPRTK